MHAVAFRETLDEVLFVKAGSAEQIARHTNVSLVTPM
jgi:hypothetical protein